MADPQKYCVQCVFGGGVYTPADDSLNAKASCKLEETSAAALLTGMYDISIDGQVTYEALFDGLAICAANQPVKPKPAKSNGGGFTLTQLLEEQPTEALQIQNSFNTIANCKKSFN